VLPLVSDDKSGSYEQHSVSIKQYLIEMMLYIIRNIHLSIVSLLHSQAHICIRQLQRTEATLYQHLKTQWHQPLNYILLTLQRLYVYNRALELQKLTTNHTINPLNEICSMINTILVVKLRHNDQKIISNFP